MATGEEKPASRWGQSAPEPASEWTQPATRSRWGNPEADAAPSTTLMNGVEHPAQPAMSEGKAAAQEPSLFAAMPPTPPVSFPLPRPKAEGSAGQERQERSHTWLEHLEDVPAKARSTRSEKPTRSRPVPRSQPRTRKRGLLSILLAALAVVLVAAIVVVSIPGLRERALALLPAIATAPASSAGQGTLIVRSNVAQTVLDINEQPYQLSSKDSGFWSISLPLNPGSYPLTVSAPNYSPASERIQIVANRTQTITAFLAFSPGVLDTLLGSSNQIAGQALTQGVPDGAQYFADQIASQPLKVTISYRVTSLVDKPGPSVLEAGNVSNAPTMLLSGMVVPDILFTAADGTVVNEYRPAPLSAADFLIGLSVLNDASSQPAFTLGNPAVLRVLTGSGAPLNVPGGVTPDLALFFALAQAAQAQGAQSGGFTCIGLVDALSGAAQPNPEDGFLLGFNGSGAHYFYRWGQLWTTNTAGQSLNPELPQANLDTRTVAQTLLDAQQAGKATGCK
jgi:hypothetical protein